MKRLSVATKKFELPQIECDDGSRLEISDVLAEIRAAEDLKSSLHSQGMDTAAAEKLLQLLYQDLNYLSGKSPVPADTEDLENIVADLTETILTQSN